MPEVPHIAFPLRRDPDGLAQVEQDELDDVRQCVHVLLLTPRGSRPLAPDIGVEDPTFADEIDTELLETQLEEMEDRARVTITSTGPDATGEQQLEITVDLASNPSTDDGDEED